MINLILIPLLLHYIGLYIFKPKIDAFYCGIGGYIGNNFNKYKFNILGLYNDSRGGDSCGVFVGNGEDKDVRYGHDKTKLYKNFVELGGLKDVNLEAPNFALLHCRKASVGGISLATAQPVVIRDADNNIVFSMIHNGTLINYKELANKYNIDFTLAETDSQIFCKIVFKVGYKILSEYDGAGAFVFWDKRDGIDTIKVFKGASLFYENDTALYVERPLFCINDKNSFWFSSMKESLEFINDTDLKIESVKDNTLITIKNGNIIGEDKIDRSARKQSDKLDVNWEKQRELSKKNYNSCQTSFTEDDYDDIWGDNWNRSTPQYSGAYRISEKASKIVDSAYVCKDKIHFNMNGLYYLNGYPCEGPIECTPSGFTNVSSVKKDIYYFVMGVLMCSYFDYLCASQFVSQNFAQEDCVEMYLAPYSPTPVPWSFLDDKGCVYTEFYHYNEKIKDTELFSGSFEPFFSFKKDKYVVNSGEITWRYEINSNGSYYNISKEKSNLDLKILRGSISKNELKKMIRKNLKTVYA